LKYCLLVTHKHGDDVKLLGYGMVYLANVTYNLYYWKLCTEMDDLML